MPMAQHFSEFPEKSTTLRGLPKFSQIVYRAWISVPFDFSPGISCSIMRFSEIQLFPNRLHTFPGIFGTICHVPVSKFSEFWLNGKRPWLSKIPWRHYLNSQSKQIQFHNEPITPSRQFTVNLCNCRNARERLATTVKWGKALTAPSVM